MGIEPREERNADDLRRAAMNKPTHIDPRAERVLSLLAGRSEAAEIVLGGYFALQHYADYRRTHDIDAWWKTRAVPAAEQAVREAIRDDAERERAQAVRAWFKQEFLAR